MSGNALATLFHPFDTGDIRAPGKEARAVFFGAEPGFRPPADFGASIIAVQGFRPAYLALRAQGSDATPEPEGKDFDLALVLAGRHRGQNESWIAQAWARLKPNGLIVVAGTKDDGIDSLRKRVGASLEIDGALSKYHGVVFWLRKDKLAKMPFAELAETVIDRRFVTAPGMFSSGRIDQGSRLLAEHLPGNLKGDAADFCAGWGYLSVELLERCPAISSVELYEADYASLEAAHRNLAQARAPTGFNWIDLAVEPVGRRFDVVVMNPPFHQGRAAEPDLGRKMIDAAAKAIKPGGQLFVVANGGLPYEAEMKRTLREPREIARDNSFKVLWARR
jgi:16S rRNA (guanine1207-N2)-methyltransferase